MRLGVGLCIGMLLWAATAWADTIYVYRDKKTGRDVFVNSLDRIPRVYRDKARVMVESAPSKAAENQPSAPEKSPGTMPQSESTSAKSMVSSGWLTELRRAAEGKNVWKSAPSIVGTVVDARLVGKGTRPLDELERRELADWTKETIAFAIVAAVVAFVIWAGLVITALRDARPGWALLMFLFAPLAHIYIHFHSDKGRPVYKTLCSLGMLAPALVVLLSAWRFHAWLSAVVQARGGHL